ncbi:serine/threonine protein kinase [Cytobacillus purgationiresistens]|uniref:Serine/threonine-protein kinase n=1 Tax=Cytobacillus purgationiresistens TaxID=863449 RepID=A0ABU0AM12_9BACI|nr:protein kinase [Cytobacillus purgationiresistens]MDQ0271776.1 serine/threonine-protein kinase [Cytobacillus purgationiresistens]
MYWRKFTKWLYDIPLGHGVFLKDSYKIEKCLGMGGYGIIYQCTDIHTQKSYVLKQLRPSKTRSNKETLRFHKEVDLMKSFNHQHIPELVDSFTIDDQEYYVMKQIKGLNIEDLLFAQQQTLSELESLKLFSKLLNIIEYLHDHHIFHSDIRPPNIIVMEGEIYLIDFGLAKKVSSEEITELEDRRQDDFFDMGECLLFLLYSNYKGKKNKHRSWLEELSLNKETEGLLKRLLGINEVYQDTQRMRVDLAKAIDSINDK